MTVLAAIQDFVSTLAEQGEGVTEIRLNEVTFQRFKDETKARSRIDLHEACGDYDRPSSPWYGSRPDERSISYSVYVDPGTYVSVKGPR